MARVTVFEGASSSKVIKVNHSWSLSEVIDSASSAFHSDPFKCLFHSQGTQVIAAECLHDGDVLYASRDGNFIPPDGTGANWLQIEEVQRETRRILNKLTPANFEKLSAHFLNFKFDCDVPANRNGAEVLIGAVVSVVFEKAVQEYEYAFPATYAKLVHRVLSWNEVISKLFRNQLLNQCQRSFQDQTWEEDIKILEERMANCKLDEKGPIQLEIDSKRRAAKRRRLGTVRFIGELFKLNLLTPKIMIECSHSLLASRSEDSLECLCKLLTIVGQKLEESISQIKEKSRTRKAKGYYKPEPDPNFMPNTVNTLRGLSEEKAFSTRVRFALLDVVELREAAWKPRHSVASTEQGKEVVDPKAVAKKSAKHRPRPSKKKQGSADAVQATTRITVFESATSGKVIKVKSGSLPEVIDSVSKTFHNTFQCLFNAQGTQVTSLESLRNGSMLYASKDGNFIPHDETGVNWLQTEELKRETRRILNKLTPANFEKLLLQFLNLKFEGHVTPGNGTGAEKVSSEQIGAVISLIFEKAVQEYEHAFPAIYAKLVHSAGSESTPTSELFRNEIVTQCQRSFQQQTFEGDKRRRLGSVRFIGELYKQDMVTSKGIFEWIDALLASGSEDSLECLCKLLTTVGQKLEESIAQEPEPCNRDYMPNTVNTLRGLSEDEAFSTRIRFALLDVVELREAAWKPSRDGSEEAPRPSKANITNMKKKRFRKGQKFAGNSTPGGGGSSVS